MWGACFNFGATYYTQFPIYRIVLGNHPWAGEGGCTEEVLEWFNYPLQDPTTDAKLAAGELN